MSKWVIDIKGEAESRNFEITVLRDNNKHGKRSYGWIDDDKLLISSDGGPCNYKLKKIVWDKMIILAQEVADELNAIESNQKG